MAKMANFGVLSVDRFGGYSSKADMGSDGGVPGAPRGPWDPQGVPGTLRELKMGDSMGSGVFWGSPKGALYSGY